jgi:2-polyprenyl-3-methyl-5-hydroxy-6-metoxy-1,4-benzoquinol methylase
MTILDLIHRPLPPTAWTEGDNIPWSDPDFSRRMLREHLDQAHNLASRTFAIIDRQVDWIHSGILARRSTRILELACGPGLYLERLARLGHDCEGIDYAHAAIEHARETARRGHLRCTYRQEDIRTAPFGTRFGLVMLVYGQLNVFRREEARAILMRASEALEPGGVLLLEPQRFQTVERTGRSGTSWYTSAEGEGLFSEAPHLCLSEAFWDPVGRTATQRFHIVRAVDGVTASHALSTEAYEDSEYLELLQQAGFEEIRFHPSLVGGPAEEASQATNFVLTGRRR